MASRRRAGMQGDPAVGIAHGPSSSSHTGSHITSSCCVQRSCNAKLHASRTGRHSGQREQLLTRPFYSLKRKTLDVALFSLTVLMVYSGTDGRLLRVGLLHVYSYMYVLHFTTCIGVSVSAYIII